MASEHDLEKAIARLMRRFGPDAVRSKIEDAAKTHTQHLKRRGRGAPSFAGPRDMLVLSLATLIRLGAGGTWRSAANWLFRNTEVRALSSVTDDKPYWRGLRSNHWGDETPQTRFRASTETVRRIITRALATLRAEPQRSEEFAKTMMGILVSCQMPPKPWGLVSGFAYRGFNVGWSCSAQHAETIRLGARRFLEFLNPAAREWIRHLAEDPAPVVVGK